MGNLFDSANYPEGIPDEVVVGDRWAWKHTDLGSDYPPASYSLKYSLRLKGTGATEIEITANESGSDYLIEIASATTAGYDAGRYSWQRYITRSSDSERVTLAEGEIEVLPDRDASTAEPRTHAEKVVALIESYIEGNVDQTALSYSISTETGSRSLSRMSHNEIMDVYHWYRHQVEAERAKTRRKRGKGTGFNVRTRFIG